MGIPVIVFRESEDASGKATQPSNPTTMDYQQAVVTPLQIVTTLKWLDSS